MISSEIELAIKLGKAVYEPNCTKSLDLKTTLDKLDIDLSQRPYHNTHLSYDLRKLVEHKGDTSFRRFIEECLEDISSSAEGGFAHLYASKRLKYFLRGIFYLYPAQSAHEGIYNDDTWSALKVNSVDDILDYADTVVLEIKAREDAIERIKRDQELNG